MDKIDEKVLKITKEIVVKFIEAGRLSPTTVHETFKDVYKTVQEIVKGPDEDPEEESESS